MYGSIKLKSSLDMLHYHMWANKKLLAHLYSIPHVFTMPLKGPFPTIARTFGHIYDVDTAWFKRILGQMPTAIGDTTFQEPKEALQRLDSLHQDIQTYFLKQEQNSNMIVQYQNTKGTQFANSMAEIIQHMVNHGTYHRGNVTTMLYQAGYQSCSTDFIVFLREKKSKKPK